MMDQRPRAAFFDLDWTLVRADTASVYTQYRRGRGELGPSRTLRVAWWGLLHAVGLMDAHAATERGYADLRGRTEASLFEHSAGWFQSGVAGLISRAARATVQAHQARGEHVAIITAQTPYIAAPFARELGIERLISTTLEVREGRLTGKVQKPVSYGQGKVVLAEREARERGFSLDDATFYSDSVSDLPLLQRVGTPVAINPDRRLLRAARREGWRVETW